MRNGQQDYSLGEPGSKIRKLPSTLQRDMRVTEDDEVDPREPAAKSRQPTLPRPCVVDHAYPQAGQVKFGSFAGPHALTSGPSLLPRTACTGA
jgi:hypothetical protein